jgi:hypothetical protein
MLRLSYGQRGDLNVHCILVENCIDPMTDVCCGEEKDLCPPRVFIPGVTVFRNLYYRLSRRKNIK